MRGKTPRYLVVPLSFMTRQNCRVTLFILSPLEGHAKVKRKKIMMKTKLSRKIMV